MTQPELDTAVWPVIDQRSAHNILGMLHDAWTDSTWVTRPAWRSRVMDALGRFAPKGPGPRMVIAKTNPGNDVGIRDSDGCLLLSERMPHKFGLLEFSR